jgi:hypothetical protein
VRLSLAWLAILLLALSVAAPVVEAFEDCQVECAAGSEEDCGISECCSCCPIARFITAAAPGSSRTLEPTRERLDMAASRPSDAEPRGILHVPKALAL